MRVDIGEDTGDAIDLSDEELNAALEDADTSALDAAIDEQYGDYLQEWAAAIREQMGKE